MRSLQVASVTNWLQGEKVTAKIKVKGQRLVVNPDDFFTLKFKGRRHPFFLEADRSTETRGVYRSKLTSYWQWWPERGHRRKEGLRIPVFRLLTLTLTLTGWRKETLRKLVRQAGDKRHGLIRSPFLYSSWEKNWLLAESAQA